MVYWKRLSFSDAPGQQAHLLGARYTTPSGETRWRHNTKVGYLSLRLMTREQDKWRLVQALSTSNACAAEWVSRKPEECVQRWV